MKTYYTDSAARTQAVSGLVYFDDIRLYGPRCMPALVKPAADLNNNCVVDLPDLKLMANDWLKTGASLASDLDWIRVRRLTSRTTTLWLRLGLKKSSGRNGLILCHTLTASHWAYTLHVFSLKNDLFRVKNVVRDVLQVPSGPFSTLEPSFSASRTRFLLANHVQYAGIGPGCFLNPRHIICAHKKCQP